MYSSLTFYLPPALLLFLRVSTLVTLFSPRYLPFYIFPAAQSTLWNSHVILPTLFFYTAFAYLPSAIQPLFFSHPSTYYATRVPSLSLSLFLSIFGSSSSSGVERPLSGFLLPRMNENRGPRSPGSRFPRKLSSYKINYPSYFIARR